MTSDLFERELASQILHLRREGAAADDLRRLHQFERRLRLELRLSGQEFERRLVELDALDASTGMKID